MLQHKEHEVLRTCVLCRKQSDKTLLHRFVLKENGVAEDEKKVFNGRGVYLCEVCFKADPFTTSTKLYQRIVRKKKL